MALDFSIRDVLHNIVAWFIQAFLPDAKKPYNLKAEFQPELDVHAVASKAAVYNIHTDPAIIEEGVNAFLELLAYLVADGYKIKTSIFNMGIRLPGEYMGDETHLPEGVYPEARVQIAAGFRNYLRNTVNVKIAGINEDKGHIGEVIDEATDTTDDVATIGNILLVHGHGIKIEGDAANNVGFFFEPASGASVQATIVPVNEPKTVKVIVPAGLTVDADYHVVIVTQSSVGRGGTLLKNARRIESTFTIKAANP
jgi:hypothetical protein